MNPLAAVPFWLALTVAWFAVRWTLRTLSSGWTQVHTNRRLARPWTALERITKEIR